MENYRKNMLNFKCGNRVDCLNSGINVIISLSVDVLVDIDIHSRKTAYTAHIFGDMLLVLVRFTKQLTAKTMSGTPGTK